MSHKLATSIAAIAVGIFASSANAADLGGSSKDSPSSVLDAPVSGVSINWTGVYVGGQVGYGNSNHNLKGDLTVDEGKCALPAPVLTSSLSVGPYNATDCAAAKGVWTSDIQSVASAFLDGINSSGVFGGGTIGADIQRGNLLFGVFGDYNFASAKATAGASLATSPTTAFEANASIEDGDSWLLAARAGYLFGSEKRALLYVLGGYGQQDVSYHAGTNNPKDTPFDKDLTFSGFVAGAGGEYALTRNLFIGIEWQHFFGGEETVFSDDGNTSSSGHGFATNSKLTDDMSSDKVMAKLKIKLNTGIPGVE